MMGELRPLGLFAFSCLIACLTQALPMWLILFSIAGICLKFWRSLKLPPALLYTMMVLLWSLLVFDSPKIMHKNTLTGALVLATLFSVLSPPHRHRIMRFHVGLFALLVSVLVIPKETYPLWFYFILSALVCISLVLHHVQAQSLFSLINFGRSFIKLAIPLTLLLIPVYYFFPEIRNNNNQAQGMSGMSGDLEPGQLASLALSDRLAFRVRFKEDPPIPAQLYWRAEVLEQSRGMRWSQGRVYLSKPVKIIEPTESIAYELMLDYQMNGMLPVLEHPTSLFQSREESQLTFQAEKNVYRSSSRYLLIGSVPSSNFRQLTPPDMELPDFETSPRVQQIVDLLKAKTPREQVRYLMNMYKDFQYTLQPGKLEKEDQLDEFLFETKKGFCEHFAASFSSLLRLAGTPSRIVIGYQGATQLGSSSIYQVTNADAHA
ncbi:MAG: DUF3488 domain-containing protein, partial [Proteobacteria bacterium]